MKLLRFGPSGRERPAAIDADGRWRDLGPALAALGATDLHLPTLGAAGLRRLARVDLARCPLVAPATQRRARLGVPYTGISKVVGIGLNYADHAAEVGLPIPAEPVVFQKATTSIAGPDDPVVRPRDATKIDWEVELGVVIGRVARDVPVARAMDHVAGYCVVDDLSERAWQMERGGTWDKGKGFDGFCPVGPWLVTADEVPDPQSLALWLDVNDQPMQRGRTSTMVFGVAELVSYVSRCMTLLPGDLIATGTPPGVGVGRQPPRFLADGDVVTLGIDGLGRQRQVIRPTGSR